MTDREFCKLYELSRPFYERIAFSYMYDKEEARDIVTDCFLYLWRHRQEVVKGYLYFAVRNRCLSCQVRHHRASGQLRNPACPEDFRLALKDYPEIGR